MGFWLILWEIIIALFVGYVIAILAYYISVNVFKMFSGKSMTELTPRQQGIVNIMILTLDIIGIYLFFKYYWFL
jgi:hypothetical protein